MLKIILRQEFNRFNCVLPFSYRFNQYFNAFQLKTIQTNCEINNKFNYSLEENPFYSKYSQKLNKALNEKGVKNKNNEKGVKSNEKININLKYDLNVKEVNEKSEQNDSKETLISEKLKPKKKLNESLDDILRLDLLRDKTTEEISEIWMSYHKSKDCIYAVIPSATYDRMFSMSYKYKSFLLPIPRTDGQQTHENRYEFILSEFKGHKCYFTPLTAYQTHKESAPVCLTISHFPELQSDKQIVLMFGEYDKTVLSCLEAQCLANQLQWYYSSDLNVRQHILLHRFNCEPNYFNHLDLIEELENHMMSLGINGGHQ